MFRKNARHRTFAVTVVLLLTVLSLCLGSLTSFAAAVHTGGVSLAATVGAQTEEDRGTPTKDEPIPDALPVWDGHVEELQSGTDEDKEAYIASCSFAGGTGKSTDPYQIATPAQFVYFMGLCNNSLVDNENNNGAMFYSLSYVITEDLVFNSDFEAVDGTVTAPTGLHEVPSLISGKSFYGTLDGGGHRLYNLYMTKARGLFSRLESTGTVKNLHLVRGYISSLQGSYNQANGPAGLFVGECYGKLVNCTASCVGSFGGAAGGIVGTFSKDAILKSCVFLGDLYSKGDNVGGIAGYFSVPSVSCVMEECINRGNVTSAGRMVGGIIGGISGASSKSIYAVKLTGCANFGDIRSTYEATETVGNAYVGGIVGYIGGTDKTVEISHCVNYGNVTAENAGGVGGILGQAGGMWSNGDTLTLTRDYNMGNVRARERAGGLIGIALLQTVLTECVNTGSVTAETAAGGFVGQAQARNEYQGISVKTICCYGTGDVTATDSNAGGVLGLLKVNRVTKLTVAGCNLRYRVTAGSNAGGVLGSGIKYNEKSTTDAEVSVDNTVLRCVIALTGEDFSAGYAVGGPETDAPISVSGQFRRFYASTTAIRVVEGVDTVLATDAFSNVRGASRNFPITALTEASLTDGTYLGSLNLTATTENCEAWAQGTEEPLPATMQAIESLPLTRDYDGRATSLSHNRWSGAPVYTRWYRYDSETGIWEEIFETPVSIGIYRVEMAILTERSSGAMTREFEIRRMKLDVSAVCAWPVEQNYEYTGEEQVFTLSGLPEGVVATYEGNANTTIGNYTARLLTVTDTTGNYEVLGVDGVPTFRYNIIPISINLRELVWRVAAVDEAESENLAPAYREEGHRLYLYDKAHPEVDLSKIMTIQYTAGCAATETGHYTASATIADDARLDSVSVVGGVKLWFETDWEITKRTIHLADYLDFDDKTVTYDGRAHTIPCTSHLPDCVNYTAPVTTEYVNAGQYTYTAICSLKAGAETNNILAEETLTRTLTIEKAVPKIIAGGRDTTYEPGVVQKIDEQPTRCYVTVDGKKLTDATLRFEYYLVTKDENGEQVLTRVENDEPEHGGTYAVKVIYDGAANYAAVETTVPLYINRATLEIDGGIVLRDADYLWTGEPQNIRLKNEGLLPDFVTAKYSEARVDPGIYTVTVEFVYNELHATDYQPIPSMKATMTIRASELVDEDTMVRVTFEGEPEPYRLLVRQRTDVEKFSTRKEFGANTSLKSLWQIELKQGLDPITESETGFQIYLPLTEAQAARASIGNLFGVGVVIREDGTYEYTTYPYPGEAKVKEINGDSYLVISTNTITYFGIVTTDPKSGAQLGQYMWFILAGVMAIPAAAIITVEAVRRYRKKKNKLTK